MTQDKNGLILLSLLLNIEYIITPPIWVKVSCVFPLIFNLFHTLDETFVIFTYGIMIYLLVQIMWVQLIDHGSDTFCNIILGEIYTMVTVQLSLKKKILLIFSKVSLENCWKNFNIIWKIYYLTFHYSTTVCTVVLQSPVIKNPAATTTKLT